MIWFLLYLVACTVQCILLRTMGYGTDTWQNWVFLGCLIVAYICGFLRCLYSDGKK